jgi:PAS domain S-box-containing protein
MDERQKQQEGELFRLLAENVRDYAIFIIDPQGTVVSWSRGGERLLGYTEAEILGQHFRRFFTPEDIAKGDPERELSQAAKTGRGEDDRWHIRKDGSRFWCSGVLTRLDEDGGRVRGFAKIMRDLTAQKRLEDELRKRSDELVTANAHKDRFMAVLAHELRNPLAPVRNVAKLISQQTSGNPVLQQASAILDRQVRLMTQLVEDLLDAARIATGKVKLSKELVEACVVIQRAVDTARPLMEERKHRLTVTLPDQPIWLHADPTRLEQVLVNLLNNAAKYTEQGGQIWVAAERQDGRAVIRVRDTGIGIAPDMLARVFTLFTQGKSGLHPKQSGLGIGLSVARSLVQLHGGTIEVKSDGQGKGSEFVVRLPLLSGRPTEHVERAEVPEPGMRPLRVLVVDDNADAADSLAILLRTGGHDARAEYTGVAAVQVAGEFRPDVVFVDLAMPVMDGLEVARRLRRQQDGGRLVLVAMTGYGQDTDREQTREAGFDSHLVKPVDYQQLQDLLAVLAEDRGGPLPNGETRDRAAAR